jgi:hypothetical protein
MVGSESQRREAKRKQRKVSIAPKEGSDEHTMTRGARALEILTSDVRPSILGDVGRPSKQNSQLAAHKHCLCTGIFKRHRDERADQRSCHAKSSRDGRQQR